jgi:peptide/nickel transport system ATP-binding protein
MTGNAILEVKDVSISYVSRNEKIDAVRNVSLTLDKGSITGLVGESGCGKSTLATVFLDLIYPPAKLQGGSLYYHGGSETVNVLDLKPPELRRYRWKEVSMIFQGSMNSLNPVMRVSDQITDVMIDHDYRYEEAMLRVDSLLEMAGISKRVKNLYPHELSGGMKQRVNIAIALACEPKALIADEPTTALDVVVQSQITRKLESLRKNLGLSILFISHDISLVGAIADRIAVMYAGKIVEMGKEQDIINKPAHQYTIALLASIPTLKRVEEKIFGIPGHPPRLNAPIQGCSFSDRCAKAQKICREEEPPLEVIEGDHYAACFFPGGSTK